MKKNHTKQHNETNVDVAKISKHKNHNSTVKAYERGSSNLNNNRPETNSSDISVSNLALSTDGFTPFRLSRLRLFGILMLLATVFCFCLLTFLANRRRRGTKDNEETVDDPLILEKEKTSSQSVKNTPSECQLQILNRVINSIDDIVPNSLVTETNTNKELVLSNQSGSERNNQRTNDNQTFQTMRADFAFVRTPSKLPYQKNKKNVFDADKTNETEEDLLSTNSNNSIILQVESFQFGSGYLPEEWVRVSSPHDLLYLMDDDLDSSSFVCSSKIRNDLDSSSFVCSSKIRNDNSRQSRISYIDSHERSITMCPTNETSDDDSSSSAMSEDPKMRCIHHPESTTCNKVGVASAITNSDCGIAVTPSCEAKSVIVTSKENDILFQNEINRLLRDDIYSTFQVKRTAKYEQNLFPVSSQKK